MAGVDVPPNHGFKVKQALIQGAGIVLFGAALASPHIAPLCQTLNNCPTAAKYNPVSTSSGNAIRRSALSDDQPLPNLNRIPKQRQRPKTQVSRLSKTSKDDHNVTSNTLSSVPPSPPVNSGQQGSMGAVTNSANVSNPRKSRQKSRTIVAISPAPVPRKIRVPKSSNAIDWKPTSPKARQEWQPPRKAKAKAPKSVRSESRRIRRVEAVRRPVKSTRVSDAPPQRLRPRRSSATRRRSVSMYRSTAVSTRRTTVYERRSSLRRHSYSYRYSKHKGSRKRK
jgi:hypothetical protein